MGSANKKNGPVVLTTISTFDISDFRVSKSLISNFKPSTLLSKCEANFFADKELISDLLKILDKFIKIHIKNQVNAGATIIQIFDSWAGLVKDKDVEKYNDNYLEEFKLLEHKKLTEEQIDKLKNNVVFDETPLGRIVMMYDKDLEGFRWYCNTSHITYETLSTLARK